jgi:hypothetical protein
MISTADLADTRSRTSYVGTGRLKVYAVQQLGRLRLG